MKQINLMLMTLFTVLAIGYAAESNAQFHAGVDFRYSIGLGETIVDNDLFTSAQPANSYIFAVSGLYEFTPLVWAGVGVNLGINNTSIMELGTTITPKPIMQFAPYLTVRLHPIACHRNAYVFTDLGYAVPFNETKNFSEGWLWNAGIGYRYMFRKHFGLNFNVSYNLQQIIGTPYKVEDSNLSLLAKNNLRHSIGIAVGLIF